MPSALRLDVDWIPPKQGDTYAFERNEVRWSMDRVMIEQHLALAARDGETRVVKQRRILAELQHDGHNTQLARDLLQVFEQTQDIFVADRDRIQDELAGEDS